MSIFRFCENIKSLYVATTGMIVATCFFVCACSSSLSIKANNADETAITFETGFSRTAEQTIKSLMGAISETSPANDAPLFSKTDIIALLQQAGLQKVEASVPTTTSIIGSGIASSLSAGTLATTGILTRTKNSLTLTLGAAQFQKLYALLDEENQAYFDLLMIPALSGDTMTASEYNELLASVFGQTFADEMTNGVFSVKLMSPDGKKATAVNTTLGELLTLTTEKHWSVTW